MTSNTGSNTNFEPSVDDVVTVMVSGSEYPQRGRIIEDYGDSVLPAERTGRTWAPARRWAIALDSGRLVFADTADLAPARP